MKKVVQFLVCLGLFVVLSASSAVAAPIKTINLNNLETILEEYEGYVIVLNFFATWCPPCKKEIPGLIDIHEERDDVVVIGLSVDQTTGPLPDFIDEYGINYEVFRANGEIQELFEVKTIPHNAVFDKSGEIVANESGYVSKRELNNFIDKL